MSPSVSWCHSLKNLGQLVVGNGLRVESALTTSVPVTRLTVSSMEVACLVGGRQKSLYQSGKSINRMSRMLQKLLRSSGILRYAVRPWLVADRQKGNFQ